MKALWSMTGISGILYGFGVGTIVAVAMPYLESTCTFSALQLSSFVASAMIASLITTFLSGPMAEWWGRKPIILWSSLCYALGTPFIVFSGGSYAMIVTGLAIQGLAMGTHGVVVPIYIAEVLPPETRGKGAAVFQLFVIIGILTSGVIGIAATYFFGAADSPLVDVAAKTLAWRSIFAVVVLPALALFLLSFLIPESPEWLKSRLSGKVAPAKTAETASVKYEGSVFKKRYLVPFFLVVFFLICQQGLGMNSVMGYSVKIFQTAGLHGAFANWADMSFKLVMLALTFLSIAWVDTKGRIFLLKLGSGGCAIGLAGMSAVFFAIQRGWLPDSMMSGVIVTACLMLYVAAFALGPGVCMWLLTTELLPGRIRAVGLAVATLFDGLVSASLQSVFLPFTDRFGYWPFFALLLVFAIMYYILVAFFTPETKGKTLEEIETYWM